MRTIIIATVAAVFTAAPIFAGALTLQADDPKSNREAIEKNAVVLAHTTACNSPEKTTITATAEGIVNGRRVSVPLHLIRLKEPGVFAVSKEWTESGTWAVTMVATNPDYRNYATSIVVPIGQGAAGRARAKVYYHAPTAAEIESVLSQVTVE